MGVCLGMLHVVHSKGNAVMDLIPCDLVSNQILVQTAYLAMDPSREIYLVHSASTVANPLTS